MDLEDLQALIWVARAGSLQAAARTHDLPRSTLRRRLARLEAQIGQTLATASPRGVQLTEAGELLVRRGGDLLASRENLARDARNIGTHTPSLRLLCSVGNPPVLNAMALSALSATLSGTRLEVDFDPRPMERLREAHDVVLHWGDPPRNLDGYTKEILRAPLRVQGSPAYLERFGVPETVEELHAHQLLHWTAQPRQWPRLDGDPLAIQPAHETSDLYLLGCMAGAGMGLALVPQHGLAVDPTIQALVTVLGDQIQSEATLRLYAPTPTRQNSATTAFVEIIEQMADQLRSLFTTP